MRVSIPVYGQCLDGKDNIVIFQIQLEGNDEAIKVSYPTREEARKVYCHFGILKVDHFNLFNDPIKSTLVDFEEKTSEEMKEYFMHHASLFN